ncbi:MAG: hypothetical protein JWM34_1631 [Ilumatobacteraceae bacterium]|nr:hypothetical protein [Ilumatobacteraceae bacterium]
MMRRHSDDNGETLVEILLTVVIIGLTVTALLSSLGNAGNAGNVQRTSVQLDAVVRNYAEATKSAVQTCTVGGSYAVTYQPPAGFTIVANPTPGSCPAVAAAILVRIDVSGPRGLHTSIQIAVRTP